MTTWIVLDDVRGPSIGAAEFEIEVRVSGQYYPHCRGLYEPGGLQLEPDEPANFEIHQVQFRDACAKTPWRNYPDCFMTESMRTELVDMCIEECQDLFVNGGL